MDSLHNEYILLFEFHPVALESADASLEVESWNLHLLAREQVVQLCIEKIEVHRMKRLEVIVPVLVLRSVLAIDEIVVKFDDLRVQPENLALLRETER